MGKNGRLPPEKGSRGERDAHGRLWKHLWYAMGSHHLPPTSAKSPNPTETGSPGRGDAGMPAGGSTKRGAAAGTRRTLPQPLSGVAVGSGGATGCARGQ